MLAAAPDGKPGGAMAKQAPRPDWAFVGNHTYGIEWVDTAEWEQRRLQEDADAVTYSTRQSIMMKCHADVSESHFQEVLLHELLHACWDATMLTHMDMAEQKDHEEAIISIQAPAILFVLKQNPHLVAWLMDDGTVRRG
jgi:hypothetical protein